jgi:hypothetical protein
MMEPHNLQHQKSKLLGYFYSTPLLVRIKMEPHNLQHQKSELLGYFTFNTNL